MSEYTSDYTPSHPLPVLESTDGLTKREWFAGMAMQGLAGAYGLDLTSIEIDSAARSAVDLADALLAELERNGGES